ncbi:MAG: hydrogenase [Deltaproteobacteria bacterium]|nr:hydrogenase [Deltaproteobacteria bacterium]
MNSVSSLLFPLGLLLAPFLFGLINRVKAMFGGRKGRPLLQMYFDLRKLLSKGAVYSRTTSWVFRAGPIVSLVAVLAALTLMPWAGAPALVSFDGDAILFVYLLALGRVGLILAALDTGSAFEGMGASREAAFSTLAEPALLLLLLALAHGTQSLSLSGMFAPGGMPGENLDMAVLLLASVGLFILALLENCRIPFDDPNTHLELTMIHEVMVLDHSGPDLALIEFGSAVKFWALGALLMNVLVQGLAVGQGAAAVIGLGIMFGLALAVGVVESTMARLRLTTVPRLIAMAVSCAVLSVILVWI